MRKSKGTDNGTNGKTEGRQRKNTVFLSVPPLHSYFPVQHFFPMSYFPFIFG